MNALTTRAAPALLAPSNTQHVPRAVSAAAAALVVVALAACSSTPLPPWVPVGSKATAPAASPGAAVGVLLPAATPDRVQTFPVAPPTPLTPQNASTVTPYNAAVAARFPAPAVVYSTPGLQPGRTSFTTPAEVSAWLQTQASAAIGLSANVLPIGRSSGGQQLEALVLAKSGGTDAASMTANGKPTVLLLGQNSADEPAATEALLVMARELAQGLLKPMLDKVNVIVVPNIHSTATAASTDAMPSPEPNRDHLVLANAETQALASVMRSYRPAVVVDVREYEASSLSTSSPPTPDRFTAKFGALQKFDVLFQYATTPNTPELLTRASEEWFRRPLLASLKAQNLSVEWAYTNPLAADDKKLVMGGPQPDTVRNVSALKNSIGLVVQSRGAGLGRVTIQRRIHSQVTALSSVLASTAQRAADLVQVRAYFDKEISALACTGQAVVQAAPVAAQYDLQVIDPLTGADRLINVDWDSSLALNRVTVRARPCAYWLPASANSAVERLLMHGVKVMRVVENGSVLADTYRQGTAANPQAIRETRSLLDIERGSYYVPLNQPLANLVIAALEPDTAFSFTGQRVLPSAQAVARIMAMPVFKVEDLP